MRRTTAHSTPGRQEGHLRQVAALVELALRPALHGPRARHRVRTRLDAQLERRAWGNNDEFIIRLALSERMSFV